MPVAFPELRQAVPDCMARALAEFHRRLLGLRYRPATSRHPPVSRTSGGATGLCRGMRQGARAWRSSR